MRLGDECVQNGLHVELLSNSSNKFGSQLDVTVPRRTKIVCPLDSHGTALTTPRGCQFVHLGSPDVMLLEALNLAWPS